jgi:hypothetical protein
VTRYDKVQGLDIFTGKEENPLIYTRSSSF